MIEISVDNRDVMRRLQGVEALLANPTPVMERIGDLLRDQTIDAFLRERDPVNGRPWAALSPVTLAIKRRLGQPSRKLVATGKLLQEVFRVRPRISFGRVAYDLNGVPYAGYHQTGTRRMPRRRFFGLSTEIVEKIDALVVNAIDDALSGREVIYGAGADFK